MEISKVYDPGAIESGWYDFWMKNDLFKAKVRSDKKPYTIVIPPPNITGILTMGHVLNNSLQDILIRWKRMSGYEACWVPGTDHAGIATQNVVEKSLVKQGTSRHILGREEFVKRVWAWKEEYGSTIIKQLKKLGCSCDWSKERFTLDEGLSHAVKEVFIRLYNKGLIYRGKYIVNWCPKCCTALSDDEVEHTEHGGNLWYIKYAIPGSDKHIVVATTRPETMLGDTAVAVNPEDKRYKNLVGKKVLLPLANREIPVIADEFVDPQFGTGIVKVTPAHDPNDFQMGVKHNLEQIVIMDITGKMNENVPEQFRGMDRYACRKKVMEELQEQELLEKTEKHTNAVGHCYRCDTVIEPYLSDQWFVKMKPLAEKALKVVQDRKITFYPERWVKVYQHWMENIRDWCISRQLWWGHRIPVWYCQGDKGCKPVVSADQPAACPACGCTALEQDQDVLDTWFSSWLWPFSTLGWPEETKELEYFYPTDTLITGPDIIFFWVARMVMAGLEFRNDIPFKEVYYTSMVRDLKGRKMSKSLGNSPDPLDIIAEYGADSLRFTIAYLSPLGQDILFAKEKCEIGRKFCNKIWNASRFAMMNLEGFSYNAAAVSAKDTLDPVHKWMLNELNTAAGRMEKALNGLSFTDYTHALYESFWSTFCDWYLELLKPCMQSGNKEQSQYILVEVLVGYLKLMSPVMPFISEEIYQALRSNIPGHPLLGDESVIKASFPKSDAGREYPEAAEEVRFIMQLIKEIRTIRTDMNVPPKQMLSVIVCSGDAETEQRVSRYLPNLRLMAKVEGVSFNQDKPKQCAVAVIGAVEVYILLEGIIDLAKEKARLQKSMDKLTGVIRSHDAKLANKQFLQKAPEQEVEKIKNLRKDAGDKVERIKKYLEMLT